MKVILDTNVLVSGLLSAGGPCGQIVALLVEGLIEPCIDERIILEYEAVLARPELMIDTEDAAAILDVIRDNAEPVTAVPLGLRLPHPADGAFLEVAGAAGAFLGTGNTRHFPRHARAGVTVMSPREFVDLLREGK
jgi:putative PIN family toxin of toxin-antitoxin system